MKVGVLVVVLVVGRWGSQERKVRKVPLMLISVDEVVGGSNHGGRGWGCVVGFGIARK